MSKQINIQGAGLAGCILAWQAHFLGIQVHLSDKAPHKSNSFVAAGMVNPVGFKRWTVHHNVGDLFPEMLEFMEKLEQSSGETCFNRLPIWRRIPNQKERDHFFLRVNKLDSVLGNWAKEREIPESLKPLYPFGMIEVEGAWLNVPQFLAITRKFFGCTTEVKSREDSWNVRCFGPWEGKRSKKGSLVRWNKGHILRVLIPDLPETSILNGGFFMLPIGNGQFKVGSTYEHFLFDNQPSEKSTTYIQEKLTQFLGDQYSFDILEVTAGTRPIVIDREPIIGKINGNTAMFNGLGTKGVLQAPFYAKRLLKQLYFNEEINKFVSLNRFYAKD
ncbi:MAG: glycine oxidase [Sphingobacteriales bacterium]|jgi:glycine oxidase